MLSAAHIIVVLIIVLIIFGAGRLPKVMGDLGRGINNFKRGLTEDDQDHQIKKLKDEDKL